MTTVLDFLPTFLHPTTQYPFKLSSLFNFKQMPVPGPRMMDILSFNDCETRTYLSSEVHKNRLHPHFGFEDGDIVLECEEIHFQVHLDKVLPRSKMIQFYLKSFTSIVHEDGILVICNLRGGAEAWACILAVIYHERASAAPSFDELCGILRIASLYQFENIREWALARLRIDFFPNPKEFYRRHPGGVETTFDNALRIFTSRWIPPASRHVELCTIAAYIIARENLFLPEMVEIQFNMEYTKWAQLLGASQWMQKELVSTTNAMVAAPKHFNGGNEPGHDPIVCSRLLAKFIKEIQLVESDVLKMLDRFNTEIPLGPICHHCINEAQFLAAQGLETMSSHLPIFFGYTHHTVPNNDWSISEELEALATRESLLAPISYNPRL